MAGSLDGPLDRPFDAIVVGGGHNGLVCAAYLARAGARTLLVEARDHTGGCASTVEAVGARVNICNCDHIFVRSTPIADELGLADHGLQYLDVDPVHTFMGWDDARVPWSLHHAVDRTLDGLRGSYPDEVDAYRRYVRAARPVAELLVELAQAPPTPGRVMRRVLERRGRGVRTLLQWGRRSVGSILRDFFRSDAIAAAAMATGPAVWGCAPDTPGTGVGAVTLAMKHVVLAGRPVGGSGALPTALEAAFAAAGGVVRCGARVERLVADGRGVHGVVLNDGETIEARAVVAACDPWPVFVEWFGADAPSPANTLKATWSKQSPHDGYESKIDARLRVEPRYRVGVEVDGTAVIAPSLDEIAAAHALIAAGRVAPRPIMFANVPSRLDRSMLVGAGATRTSSDVSPNGEHVLSLEVLYTPWALDGGWAGSTEPRRWLEQYASMLDNATEFLDGIVDWRVMDPPAYEREFSMRRGYAPSYAGGPLAALLGKDKALTRYETPVRGLYLSGAATFPGAGVWGASGRNAAYVVLRALS